jgi:Spy/CpxP family protein refolding chaperone
MKLFLPTLVLIGKAAKAVCRVPGPKNGQQVDAKRFCWRKYMKSIKTMGKKDRLAMGLTAAVAALTLGLAVYVPAAEAGKAAGEVLIDGDFEDAMLKHFEKRFFKRIDATEAQQTQLSEIFQTQMKGSRSQREAIRHKLIDLADSFAAEGSTDEQIKAKVLEVRSMHEKLMDTRVDTALKVRQVLTPEQRKTMADRMSSLLSGNAVMKRRLGTMID